MDVKFTSRARMLKKMGYPISGRWSVFRRDSRFMRQRTDRYVRFRSQYWDGCLKRKTKAAQRGRDGV